MTARRARPHPRGGILLEVLLSIALFVGAASFALGATRTVLTALERSRSEAMALDIARSKLAELDAGIITFADLRDDADTVATVGSIDAFEDAADDDPSAAAWAVDVETDRTEHDGLLLVSLTVRQVVPDDAGARGASVTLRQLMSFRAGADESFEIDEMLDDLEDDAPRGGRAADEAAP